MGEPIDAVAVLGAGTMGAAIAAHLVNAGVSVLLLDVVPEGAESGTASERNQRARTGLQRVAKAKPAALFSRRFETLIKVGNLEDDLEAACACDVIVEAVVENLGVKRALYARLDALGGKAVIASNTSGLPLRDLVVDRSESFRSRFIITHFFNPPRYLKLVEIVTGPETSPQTQSRAEFLCGDILGKGIVFAKDTPNFIANRIGTFCMLRTLEVAANEGYSVEEVDLIFGRPAGRPKSAIFRTVDVVGIDTLLHVAENCFQALEGDEKRAVFSPHRVLKTLVARGWLGAKNGQGFYRKGGGDAGAAEQSGSKASASKKQIFQLDLNSLEYTPLQKPRFASVGATKGIEDAGARIRALVSGDDRAATLAQTVIYETLAYAAARVGDAADSVVDIDRAMRWGFGWELGPFEIWDALGVKQTANAMKAAGIDLPVWLQALLDAGETSFYPKSAGHESAYLTRTGDAAPLPSNPKEIDLNALRASGAEVERNGSASVLDLGEGVFCLEFHSKMNALDPDIVFLMNRALERAEQEGVALVVGNQASDAFCAGANLFALLVALQQNNYEKVEEMVVDFQKAVMRWRRARVPVVAAPFGLALGGGAEVVMACQNVRAAAELYIGCVEVGVGLIPAGGGCMEMAARASDRIKGNPAVDVLSIIRQPFEYLATARISTSAEDARDLGYLRVQDTVSMRRETVIHDAKQLALGLARAGHRPPPPRQIRVAGRSGSATLRTALQNLADAHRISDHDALIGQHLARILAGGDVPTGAKASEQDLLDLEREAFLSLCGEEKTRARIQHMLTTNKPLRN